MAQKKCRAAAQIMVVDSDQCVLHLIGDELERNGYCVHTARCGEEALDLARECKIDLVICDLYLKGMTGLQASLAIIRMHPEIPIVIMSAKNDPESRSECLDSGISDIIVKPLDLSNLISVIKDNLKRRKHELQRLSKKPADVLLATIKAMSGALDVKAQYEPGHSANVAELSVQIGAELGLSKESLAALELAAYLRDVGKIDTPELVLSKPGKLSDTEWFDVLKHPSAGASFFDGRVELSEVASIIRHHHERVDGSGYPDTLKGDAIPLASRILSVVDAYEAMICDRPYRAAITPEAALAELAKNARTQFDSSAVAAAARVIEWNRQGQSIKLAA